MNKIKIKQNLFNFIKVDLIQELIFSAIGCLLFTFVFFLFPDECWEYPFLEAICLLLGLFFFLLFIFLNQINPKNNFFKVNYKRNIILFSIFLYAGFCFLYFKTNFWANGVQGDNFFRTASVTKMANSGYPQDFIYKDFSAFYSPLYWYILAIIARIFQIKPYRMLKLGVLFLYYILPIILFEVWKSIYKEKVSYVITFLSMMVLFDAYSPDKTLGVVFIIPFFMYYYKNCTNKKFKLRNYLLGGLIGSMVFCFFFLYFFIVPIYFLIEFFLNRKEFIKNLKHITILTLFIGLFSCWFWIPLFRDIIFWGFESHQNRYFGVSELTTQLPRLFQFGSRGVILFFGLIYVIKKYKIAQDSRIQGNLLIATCIIYIIGFIGILMNSPILHTHFLQIFYYILLIAFSKFLIKLVCSLNNGNFMKFRKFKINLDQIWSYIFISFIFSMSISNIAELSSNQAYDVAYEEDVRYDLIDVVEELDYENKIFLTSHYYIAPYLPVYLFLLPNPYYNHPSALYYQRVKFLVELSECETSKAFYNKIIENKFGPIDFFWLETDNTTNFVFTIAIDNYPEGRDYYDIHFKPELFNNSQYFKRFEIKGEIIYKTRY